MKTQVAWHHPRGLMKPRRALAAGEFIRFAPARPDVTTPQMSWTASARTGDLNLRREWCLHDFNELQAKRCSLISVLDSSGSVYSSIVRSR